MCAARLPREEVNDGISECQSLLRPQLTPSAQDALVGLTSLTSCTKLAILNLVAAVLDEVVCGLHTILSLSLSPLKEVLADPGGSPLGAS